MTPQFKRLTGIVSIFYIVVTFIVSLGVAKDPVLLSILVPYTGLILVTNMDERLAYALGVACLLVCQGIRMFIFTP